MKILGGFCVYMALTMWTFTSQVTFAASIDIFSSGITTEENPVEYIITDPQGRRTGFDPTAPMSKVYDIPIRREIPNCAYAPWGLGDDDENSAEHGTRAGREFLLENPLSGTYGLTVIGVMEAAWSISADFIQEKFSQRTEVLLTGFSTPGSSTTYTLQYSPVPGEPVGIKKIVTFASLTEEIKIARRLNLIKNDGIRTSLLAKVSSAQQAKDRNQPKTAGNVLNALLKEISAQRDKGIDKTASQIFAESIQALMGELR